MSLNIWDIRKLIKQRSHVPFLCIWVSRRALTDIAPVSCSLVTLSLVDNRCELLDCLC